MSSSENNFGVSLIGDCCMRSAETAGRRTEQPEVRKCSSDDEGAFPSGVTKALAAATDPKKRSRERANITSR